jgi:AcrR family transcriptional regulator
MMSNAVIKQRPLSRGRPKTIDYESTLDLAINAYWSKGLDRMSVNEVCRLARVSKPSLYREFGNEDGLLQAVFRRYGNRFTKTIRSLLAKHEDFQSSMKELIDFISYVRDPEISPNGCLGVKGYQSLWRLGLKSKKELFAINDDIFEIFEEWVERSGKKICLGNEWNTHLIAEFIHSMFAHGMKMNGDEDSPEKIKRIMNLALSGLVDE